jgi:hypothetical protein
MQENIPEAVASVTYSITSSGGYPALFTVRGVSGFKLLETMEEIEETLVKKGYKPQTKSSGFVKKEKEYLPDRKCPTCGGKLVVIPKKDGSGKFYKCENNKWNPMTKRAEGCQYVDWNNPPKPKEPMSVEAYEQMVRDY